MKKILTLAMMLTASIASYAQTTDSSDTTAVDQSSTFLEGQQQLNFARQVYDRAVYVKNISARINLGITGMGKDIAIDGRLQMRRNQVIRITITPFGLMEVARLEFTPDYVLLIDRMHKEYVKADYADVPFIKAEGITFYTLQSLFWNELFQPGKEKLGDSDLSAFTVAKNDDGTSTLSYDADKMNYQWTADGNAFIKAADITYCKASAQQASVNVTYDRFTPLGVKQFPTQENVTFRSKALSSGSMSLNINMGSISTDSNWDANTNVSDRYRQITPEEFLDRLGNL